MISYYVRSITYTYSQLALVLVFNYYIFLRFVRKGNVSFRFVSVRFGSVRRAMHRLAMIPTRDRIVKLIKRESNMIPGDSDSAIVLEK